MPTSNLPSTALSGGLSERQASAAPPPAASCCKKESPRKFINEFVARAKSLKIGNGLDESVQVGPQVNKSQIETSAKYVDIATKEGAKLLCGGHALTNGDYAKGTFFEPTVLAAVNRNMRIACEEVFGPVVALIEFDTFEEAIEIANSIDYGFPPRSTQRM